MTNQHEERLSSLMDGELSEQESRITIGDMLKNPTACACWERYHLISDTLKRSLPSALNPGFSAGVMDALKHEPTILAPARRTPGAFTKRVAGFAVAASVAAMGVLGVQYLYQQDGQMSAPVPMAQTTPTQGQSPVIAQSPVTQSPQVQSPLAQSPLAQSQGGSALNPGIQLVQQGSTSQESGASRLQSLPPNLNRYLVDHSQQTARGVQGVIPYARIVTYPAVGADASKTQK